MNRANVRALNPDLRGYRDRHLRKLNRHKTETEVLDWGSVPLYDGRPYWTVNRNEFFAEMSAAFFGRHSMYPRNRVDLFEWDDDIARTIGDLWEVDASPEAVNETCYERFWTTWWQQ